MIQITIKLHGALRKFLPGGGSGNAVTLDLPDGACVADLLGALGIPTGQAKMLVRGQEHLELTASLEEGQEISVFPPLVGG